MAAVRVAVAVAAQTEVAEAVMAVEKAGAGVAEVAAAEEAANAALEGAVEEVTTAKGVAAEGVAKVAMIVKGVAAKALATREARVVAAARTLS